MTNTRIVTTIREQVYHILRDKICRGDYPAGYRLQEIKLTEQLNVSRSPVREAMRQLVSDGLLIEIPNKGVYVREFTVNDIEEIFDLRVMLESYAIFHSVGHVTSSHVERLLTTLANLEDSFGKDDLESYIASDEKLHVQIVEIAGNSLVNDTYERVRSMSQQFRVLSLMNSQRFRESLDEHRSIVHALIAGDVETADAVNQHHLKLACDTIKDRLTQNAEVKPAQETIKDD